MAEFVIFWLILCVLVATLGVTRGRSGVGMFFLAFLLSPLVAFIYIVVSKKLPRKQEREAAEAEVANSKKCPFCAETIKAEATVCRYCGRDLPAPAAGTCSDDQKFEVWLTGQKPPIKLAGLSPQEREEQRKAFEWANGRRI